jgi:hypothetical protein
MSYVQRSNLPRTRSSDLYGTVRHLKESACKTDQRRRPRTLCTQSCRSISSTLALRNQLVPHLNKTLTDVSETACVRYQTFGTFTVDNYKISRTRELPILVGCCCTARPLPLGLGCLVSTRCCINETRTSRIFASIKLSSWIPNAHRLISPPSPSSQATRKSMLIAAHRFCCFCSYQSLLVC